jgi:hypothetical protein
MTASATAQDWREHFAHCVQVFGGVTPTSRRLAIDERAIRRFVSGEIPVSPRLLADTANALGALVVEAQAAANIAAGFAAADGNVTGSPEEG